MRLLYNIEIRMSAMNKMNDYTLSKVTKILGAEYDDYDELETYRAVLFFVSDVNPSAMRERVKQLLADLGTIHYVDVVYRWNAEINADRFVIWGDGREKDYTGHMTYEED